jgi:hypothetical protein
MPKKKKIIFEPGEYICTASFYDNKKVWKANQDRLTLTAQVKLEDKREMEHFSIIRKPKRVIQPFAPDLDINAVGNNRFPEGVKIQQKTISDNSSSAPLSELEQDGLVLPEIDGAAVPKR